MRGEATDARTRRPPRARGGTDRWQSTRSAPPSSARKTPGSSPVPAATSTTSSCTNLAHAAILRSPYAHARIRCIDTRAAAAMPGVIAVFTGAGLRGPAGAALRVAGGRRQQRWWPVHQQPRHAPAARARRREVGRRGRRDGHRGDPRAGVRRDRGDRGRLGSAARGRGRLGGGPARCAPAPRERAEQRRLHLVHGRQGRHRRRHRQRGGRGPPAARQPAADPQPDGGAAAPSAATNRAPTSTPSG